MAYPGYYGPDAEGGNAYMQYGSGAAQYDQYGPSYYGTNERYGPYKPPVGFGKQQRKDTSTKLVAIVLGLVLPWALFVIIFASYSLEVHYKVPQISTLASALGFLIVVYFGYCAISAAYKRANDDPTADPSWFTFFFVTCLIATMAGIALGDYNFVHNMRPYFDVRTLNTYSSVDPSSYTGQQLMDAGRIQFIDTAHVDTSKSMGFRNLDTYCVAPIVNGTGPQTYDFWAVGTNCCLGTNQFEYHCGEYNNPAAHSGLRLMNDDQRSYYRLAVQQAEATYNIQAGHPIMMYWMQDPDNEIQAYQDDGQKFFMMCVLSFFAIQLVFVVIAVVIFSKLM